jgi:hypothetical protein
MPHLRVEVSPNSSAEFLVGNEWDFIHSASHRIAKAAFTHRRLARVVRRARRTPTTLVPEDSHVALVRNEVVNARCRGSLAFSGAVNAPRVINQERLALAPPLCVVATLGGGFALRRRSGMPRAECRGPGWHYVPATTKGISPMSWAADTDNAGAIPVKRATGPSIFSVLVFLSG